MKNFALIGISGAGKSTLTQCLGAGSKFKVVSASELIKLSKAKHSDQLIEHDKLRLGNIDENQTHLIRGYESIRDGYSGGILIEAHAVIDTTSGLIEIPADVFEALSIEHFFHLYVPAEKIIEFRKMDKTRDRPLISVARVSDHQTKSVALTAKIATELSVPMTIIGHNHADYLLSMIETLSPH